MSWIVSSSGDWSSASCWSTSSAPTANDAAYVGNGGTVTITHPGEVCSNLTLGGSTMSGTVQMLSGSLVEGSPVFYETIGNATPGAFLQSGGVHSATTTGLLLGNVGGATGTYVLSGGSLNAPFVGISNSGSGSFSQSGGTCSLSNELDVGYDGGNSGTFTLSGTGLLLAWHEVIGDGAHGTFVQSGGTNSVSAGLVLSQNTGVGTYNLNGGLLVLGGSLAKVSGSAAFNISGGTLRAGSVSSLSVATTVGSGNAVFDTGGSTLTVAAPLSGGGAVFKSGKGLLILSGSDSYSGGTVVTAGILQVSSASSLLTGSRLTVGAGGSVVFGPAAASDAATANPQAVPEPSAAGILVMSAVGFFAYRRCRAIKRQSGNC